MTVVFEPFVCSLNINSSFFFVTNCVAAESPSIRNRQKIGLEYSTFWSPCGVIEATVEFES
jgi:hypothetical protein